MSEELRTTVDPSLDSGPEGLPILKTYQANLPPL